MNPKKVSLWLVWLFFFWGTLSYRFILATDSPTKEPLDIKMTILSFVMILSSLVCRIIILPKAKDKRVAFICGLALAEFVSLLGIFLMPYYQDLFMTLSIMSIITFIPYYIKLPDND